ncbi:hypothetical protein P3T27_002144 [Kitasatospora sp. MAA19]|uniref:hypothetical protein n=1 Tax=Kitasatospora sp. MAA19 TaxID=3035090 RepID=UPI002476F97B|nr:hypothetical protein [Kitasatospora sp. MAA19]MDH6705434.1 hypothetical protein [Kitasatospora sp. MAA19]
MSSWTGTREGFARLGAEYTPDYQGYVINVRDEGEDWYVYAWDDRNGVTAYLARAATENSAREILEIHAGFRRSGYLCEAWVSKEVGHCPENATGVRWADFRTERRIHSLFCPAHSEVHPSWAWTPISTYLAEWGIDPENTAMSGGRRGPFHDGEQTWVVITDGPCASGHVLSSLRRALAAKEPVWAGTEYVNAARELQDQLPHEGPWTLTRTELHTIRRAMSRFRGRGPWCQATGQCGFHDLMVERITEASEHAIRHRQQGLS